ncbi:four-carbon acid sugar kinase family protein [Clostridium estertheticum]|uniref:four-carbon acid sugar kinase family protein n=1 Tax=Clostridium estertheticum TaxID=238834 RepID=UPI001C0CB153|nr:four-carbon acid sugar kinase family protein [Clostridium estertheticum]MBU3200327.1 four-carbon acid sugar kinase family protein [Clostridium estertheticum]WAG67161.1 four-carbon acid sugar kinase family protein [Clostridium estertheticum]
MFKIAIIADDLTGASDSGVQFARKGIETHVIFDINLFSDTSNENVVIVVDTDSRAIKTEDAYKIVKCTVSKLHDYGFDFIYKKIDSTLRGNLGYEIDAILDSTSFDYSIVVPAFPKLGRTTVEGVQYLNHVPVSETEVGRDPRTPVKESNVVKLLSLQTNRKCTLIKLDIVRGGIVNIIKKINEERAHGNEIFIFDAETEDDLEIIAASQSHYDPSRILWVGSAGLAEFIPKYFGFPDVLPEVMNISPTKNPVILVSGSLSQLTSNQVNQFNKLPQVAQIELNVLDIIQSDKKKADEIKRCFDEVSIATKEGKDISLYTCSLPEYIVATKLSGKELGLDGMEVSNQISNALGEIMSKILKEIPLAGMILTGGDTAKAVCKWSEICGISLINEIEPGIPLGKPINKFDMYVVTKAGAFGKYDSLIKALKMLKGGVSI